MCRAGGRAPKPSVTRPHTRTHIQRDTKHHKEIVGDGKTPTKELGFTLVTQILWATTNTLRDVFTEVHNGTDEVKPRWCYYLSVLEELRT